MSDNSYMGIPREKIDWYPTIDTEACTGCGECVEFCDHEVFSMEDSVSVVVNPYNCVVGCTSCGKICPADAISFPDQKDLVTQLKKLRAERDAG